MSPLFRLIIAAIFCLAGTTEALAQGLSAPSPSADKIDVSAEESLEWLQDQRLYIARGKARAILGTGSVEADLLTARQRKSAAGKSGDGGDLGGQIDLITAEGHVKIEDPQQQVFGEKAVYDVDRKFVRVTGAGLKYVTPRDVVTAQQSLDYDETKAIAVARGRAVADHQGSKVEADLLTARFVKNAAGARDLAQIEAEGNVIILTNDGAVSRGDRGVYDVKADKAILMDHVRITRGETQLAGARAEVDFKTGQSRLLSGEGRRVRALLPVGGAKQEGAQKP